MADTGVDPKLLKFQRSQLNYIENLPAKLERITQAWEQQLGEGTGSAESREDLTRQLHNLAGSAGTFHFHRISRLARELELRLEQALSPDVDEQAREEISEGLDRLRLYMEQGPELIITGAPVIARPDPNRSEHLVYVIEDDGKLAAEIQRQLTYFDYQVETFPHAGAAMTAMARQIPAALIIDVILPEGQLAGVELAQRLQAFSDKKVPQIFISVRDDWRARLAATRAGCQAYLVKPLDFSQLLDQLDLMTHVTTRDPYRVLIVDDMVELAEHYSLVLESAGMTTRIINDPNNIFDVLKDFNPEFILMDVNMPECTGLEAAKVIRQKEDYAAIPIVYLSMESNPDIQRNAMRVGGDDFLEKPILDMDLVAAVSIRTERFRQIRSLISRDSLTGLLNHATISTFLENEVSRANRSGTETCFALLDIDSFKAVNDTNGHLTGDRVIKTLSRLLQQRLRKTDFVGRHGGDEFGIIFPDTPIATASAVLDELRQQFSEIIHAHQGNRFSCTLSAGIAATQPGRHTEDLVRAADEALYRAKRGGRNRVEKEHQAQGA